MARAGLFRSCFCVSKNFNPRAIERVFGWERLLLLRRTLFQADIYTSLPRFLNIVILCACAGIMVGWCLRNPFSQLALGNGGGFLPFLYLRQRQRRKARLIEQQLPDTMELLARSLLSGHTLPSAVDLASQEIPAPLGTELRLAHEEQRLGLTMPEALEKMAGRTCPSRDLRYCAAAINIRRGRGDFRREPGQISSALIRGRLDLKSKGSPSQTTFVFLPPSSPSCLGVFFWCV